MIQTNSRIFIIFTGFHCFTGHLFDYIGLDITSCEKKLRLNCSSMFNRLIYYRFASCFLLSFTWRCCCFDSVKEYGLESRPFSDVFWFSPFSFLYFLRRFRKKNFFFHEYEVSKSVDDHNYCFQPSLLVPL